MQVPYPVLFHVPIVQIQGPKHFFTELTLACEQFCTGLELQLQINTCKQLSCASIGLQKILLRQVLLSVRGAVTQGNFTRKLTAQLLVYLYHFIS